MPEPRIVRLEGQPDVILASRVSRNLARELGFNSRLQDTIALAVEEIACNVVRYAGSGEMSFARVEDHVGQGIAIVARDKGPGIADIPLAMQDGYSSGGGLGGGLPAARRLMDRFQIESGPGTGTVVSLWKYLPSK